MQEEFVKLSGCNQLTIKEYKENKDKVKDIDIVEALHKIDEIENRAQQIYKNFKHTHDEYMRSEARTKTLSQNIK